MSYNLFIDDARTILEAYDSDSDWGMMGWVIARSSCEAIEIIKSRGIPDRLSLDFMLDNWGDDNIMKFLLAFRKISDRMPEYRVHSSYPGAHNKIHNFVVAHFENS